VIYVILVFVDYPEFQLAGRRPGLDKEKYYSVAAIYTIG
jgi:hypothetical protein